MMILTNIITNKQILSHVRTTHLTNKSFLLRASGYSAEGGAVGGGCSGWG